MSFLCVANVSLLTDQQGQSTARRNKQWAKGTKVVPATLHCFMLIIKRCNAEVCVDAMQFSGENILTHGKKKIAGQREDPEKRLRLLEELAKETEYSKIKRDNRKQAFFDEIVLKQGSDNSDQSTWGTRDSCPQRCTDTLSFQIYKVCDLQSLYLHMA